MKVCFLTSCIYKDNNISDIPSKFDRFGNYDFFLFTNLDKTKHNTYLNNRKFTPGLMK